MMVNTHPKIKAIQQIHRPAQSARELGYRMPAQWEPQACVWVVPPHNPETWPGCFEAAQQQHADWVEAMRPHVEVRTAAELGIATDDSWIRDFGPLFVVKHPPPTDPKPCSGCCGTGGSCASRSSNAQTEAQADAEAQPHCDNPAKSTSCESAPQTTLNADTSATAIQDPLAAHDFHFNAWGAKYEGQRPLDDVVPQHLAKSMGIPLWVHDFVLEGGSIDVNGKGAVMTTRQCLFSANRNPWASAEVIEQTLHDALGTRHVIWLPGGIVGDDTDGHIDDVARFVNAQTVVVVVAPEGHSDHAITRRNLNALRDAVDQDGNKLNIIGLPTPDPVIYDFPNLPGVDEPGQHPVPASYANFLISNSAVFVPVFGQASDDIACAVLERVLPGKSIVPIRAEHLAVGLGALHCLSMQQPQVFAPGS